ncbi:hypothetical protein HMPREF1210_01119 [Paenisporosarcina sp. HGH0030]|uniref:hypothetical protein n=1 Tax=Paenisporosarcina sp. HGH0030 TaxID=1078085 RepID=UPI00034E95E8|nr:hypothetical protein [Paenisporosarcina sp. HGH0030]EPD52739.1 hypothetical protein HMPREF1210_01119 [Paenisporosarcina sp. HGH0030]
MSDVNFLPGISNFSVYSPNSKETGYIEYNPHGKTDIHVEFTLTGLNQLKSSFYSFPKDFYIYVNLFKHLGGISSEVVSTAFFHCSEDLQSKDSFNFLCPLAIDAESDYIGDFIEDYYFLEIAFSENEVEDGSDLNFLYNHDHNKLIKTKLAFKKLDIKL